MTQKFEHADDLKAYRENEHIKVFATTIEQRKSQHAKHMVKKRCTPNTNEATDEFDYA
jgi:hypothetical protein